MCGRLNEGEYRDTKAINKVVENIGKFQMLENCNDKLVLHSRISSRAP